VSRGRGYGPGPVDDFRTVVTTATLLVSHIIATVTATAACVLLMAGHDALKRGDVKHGMIIGAAVGLGAGCVTDAAVLVLCGPL
jgi:hypothetical protein